ncbi:MAG: hypothetical protein P8184_14445, partial [Calditrichia bacterium]
MKHIILLLIFHVSLFIPFRGMSQSNTGSLSGKVQGFESGEMLSKVLIRLEGTNKSALTNN